MQIISGVGVAAYWTSTFVFDVMSYLIPFTVFLTLLHAFHVESEFNFFNGGFELAQRQAWFARAFIRLGLEL